MNARRRDQNVLQNQVLLGRWSCGLDYYKRWRSGPGTGSGSFDALVERVKSAVPELIHLNGKVSDFRLSYITEREDVVPVYGWVWENRSGRIEEKRLFFCPAWERRPWYLVQPDHKHKRNGVDGKTNPASPPTRSWSKAESKNGFKNTGDGSLYLLKKE